MTDTILDPLCSGSLRSRVEGCDTHDTKQERARCTMALMNCTDRPSKPPVEYSACQLCGINNGCNTLSTIGLRDQCLRTNCDSTGNCDGTFPDSTLAPTPTTIPFTRFSLKEAYKNPF